MNSKHRWPMYSQVQHLEWKTFTPPGACSDYCKVMHTNSSKSYSWNFGNSNLKYAMRKKHIKYWVYWRRSFIYMLLFMQYVYRLSYTIYTINDIKNVQTCSYSWHAWEQCKIISIFFCFQITYIDNILILLWPVKQGIDLSAYPTMHLSWLGANLAFQLSCVVVFQLGRSYAYVPHIGSDQGLLLIMHKLSKVFHTCSRYNSPVHFIVAVGNCGLCMRRSLHATLMRALCIIVFFRTCHYARAWVQ